MKKSFLILSAVSLFIGFATVILGMSKILAALDVITSEHAYYD